MGNKLSNWITAESEGWFIFCDHLASFYSQSHSLSLLKESVVVSSVQDHFSSFLPSNEAELRNES